MPWLNSYAQAPFTEVLTPEEILSKYGETSVFASGLIVDALHAFNNNLWQACSTAMGTGLKLTDEAVDLLKRDWVRRHVKFAHNYFDGDLEKTSFCLKDSFNLHKWSSIRQSIKPINFAANESEMKHFQTSIETAHIKANRVFADKGSASRANRDWLKSQKIKSGIMHKAVKNKPLTARQKLANRLVSQKRYIVEQCFGTMKRLLGMRRARYLGTVKVNAQLIMKSICLNLIKAANKILAIDSSRGVVRLMNG